MNPVMQGPATMIRRMGSNLAYNFKYIPADKADWKPAPTAKSALEIADHLSYFVKGMTGMIGSGAWTDPGLQPVTTLEQAANQVRELTGAYADALEKLTPADLERKVDLPFGSFSLAEASSFPIVDTLHHHGQLAYLQTLLGDTQDHFEGFGT